LLIQTAPSGAVAKPSTGVYKPALAGPVVDAAKEGDVVTSQSQVDDLLASLGF
jgi:chemotaxis protein CheZ